MKLLWLKIKTSFRAVGRMFVRYPQYIFMAMVLSVVFLWFLLWIFNLALLGQTFFDSSLSISGKLGVIFGIFGSIFTNFEAVQATTLVVFAILFGINISILIFVIKSRGRAFKNSGKSAAGVVFAVIATGCGACGTSILTPILLSIGSTGAVALSGTIGLIISYLSMALILYSIYSLGASVATALALSND